MKNKTRKITQNSGAWICTCGNTELGEGFYPCDETGKMVEPTHTEWLKNLYVCAKCGQIIDQDTRCIVEPCTKSTD